ncbi:thiamine pyrophosphate-dependent dehydrogenase E1 component subunit alpha [Euzebya tangerina]|uniref:thiamine pyrophosphate-dependent dehydrogenase E1 component subunit alpha n=1 Tax=Euzebya tangerina TaxID=591198 RepID=UPI000E31DEBA|nr:thiamine pyrophosphate-dependent dehydrogenase E1 component subunit alpha [Euzebya tangerina]
MPPSTADLRQPPQVTLPSLTDVGESEALALYRSMFLIRRFEETGNELFLKGRVPGTIHLCLGQEAVVVGTSAALEPEDRITLTHRGHGQALAKGVAPGPLLAEIMGKVDGVCRGMGGSLHVGDWSVGALPAIAIVGASSPIATGLAFAAKRQGTGRVVVNYFGDGAASKGELHEAMNLAALWELPVIFLCENNVYASTTHISEYLPNDTIAERATAYRMPGVSVYGNDPLTVRQAVATAAERARRGGGPTLVECLTYRRGGHKRDDPGSYRNDDEVAAWMARDPVPAFRARLLDETGLTAADVEAVEAAVEAELDDAQRFAHESPHPPLEQRLEFVHA